MSDQNVFSGEMTEKQRLFREEYKRNIAKWYSGWGHLLSIYIPGIAVIAFCITQIENPPYEPIQRREEQTRVVTPEQVFYVDESGKEVTDICDTPVTPDTMEP